MNHALISIFFASFVPNASCIRINTGGHSQLQRRAWIGSVSAAVVLTTPLAYAADEAGQVNTKKAIAEAESLVKFGLAEQSKGEYEKSMQYFNNAVKVAPDFSLG